MKRIFLFAAIIPTCILSFAKGDAALDSLMERLSAGLSQKIIIDIKPDTIDYYIIARAGNLPHITANNRISAASGLRHYLTGLAGVQLTWDCMTPPLPDPLPLPSEPIRHRTRQKLRYYLNYCTHSYSMAFWDKRRWQREIDWMALHGINAPLAMTGTDAVWHFTLRRLGYPEEKIQKFIAAPAYQAWWLMNNLEGEGATMTAAQLQRQTDLQLFILARMRELDMEPVFPGYSGMVPHDAKTELGLEVADPGKWCGYPRPSFLLPTDPRFPEIARIYYEEQRRLFGTSKYYSMDPFHEGGNTDGVDLAAAARAIEKAMSEASPRAVWLIQGWQENPRTAILDALPSDRLTVLDLNAETNPQWSARGHRGHPWAWCMLLNFGGNEGLYGKLNHVTHAVDAARHSETPPAGIGLTMEGIENNPVMYELVTDLVWCDEVPDISKWLRDYIRNRYGKYSPVIDIAWKILAESVYGAGAENRQQGTTESPFCARPSDNPVNASSWANAEPYYKPGDVIRAARIFASVADSFSDSPHYLHDLIDITRQAVAEAGRLEARKFAEAAAKGDSAAYHAAANRFLSLILTQDSLLASTPSFRLGHFTEAARESAATAETVDEMERDARRLVTTWGSRAAADSGGLHDYSNREWQGLLADFYYPRWKRWFRERLASWPDIPEIDFYAMESLWVDSAPRYSAAASCRQVNAARRALAAIP